MTFRFPSPSSTRDMTLLGCASHQSNLLMSPCPSDSALHVPKSPQLSERSADTFGGKPKRRISFNECVSVREFECNSRVSEKDLTQLSPVAVSMMPPKIIVCSKDSQGSLYQEDDMESLHAPSILPASPSTSNDKPTLSLSQLLESEVKSVLMVDSHDIFLSLFSKRLQEAFPHAQVLTAHSSEEALQLLSKQSFDILLTEERLCVFHRQKSMGSGSALLAHLRANHAAQFQSALLIGVSAHWQSDHATMAQSGADYCWSKAPPPTLHRPLLEEMMGTLLRKRGKHELLVEFTIASSANPAADPKR